MVSTIYKGSPNDVVAREKPDPTLRDAWKSWASVCQRNNTPTIVQLCHPGRQSPLGAGTHGLFEKNLAPSPIKLNLGPSLFAQAAVSLIFGTPREMTLSDIETAISEFVRAAVICHEAGFKGIELHGAHGYLLAQFLSPKTNHRNDAFGGDATRRTEIVLRVIKGIREATSPEFCIGIKMNSVDVSDKTESGDGGLEDGLLQMGLVISAGIDFIEISGGTYENPRMLQPTPSSSGNEVNGTGQEPVKASTAAREAFFLSFAKTARERFPTAPLMVTGGFRTRSGMNSALKTGACDLIGIGRPSAVIPKLPKELLEAEKSGSGEEVSAALEPVQRPWWLKYVPIVALGAGLESAYYGMQIQRMGKGEKPIDTRVKV